MHIPVDSFEGIFIVQKKGKKSKRIFFFKIFCLIFSVFMYKYFMKILFIGIDEAGRGAWAGPLAVAAVATFDE